MKVGIFVCGLILGFLTGCYDDIVITLREPHQYKGKVDVHEFDAPTRAKRLAIRFNAVQLDR